MKMNNSIAGFTLLELLVVMAIIAILAAIAVPKFSDYRKRAFDTRALSDLRNVAAAQELYFIENETYSSCQDASCEGLPGISRLSKGVNITMSASQDGNILTGEASHSLGSGKKYQWNSELGGLVD